MVTVERPIPPNQMERGDATAEIIDTYSGSEDNPRKLPIEGTRDALACRNPTLEVTFYDQDGNVIDPSPTVIRITVVEGAEFWNETIEAPEKAVMCNIKLYCGADLQDSREKIGFASAQRLTSTKSARIFEVEKSGTNAILMTINNPAAVDPHDSDSIHVIRYISHKNKTSFSPYFTTNPGSSTRRITYSQLGPGRYFARLVYVPVNGPAETYTDSTVKID
jgi:hypothetical protein